MIDFSVLNFDDFMQKHIDKPCLFSLSVSILDVLLYTDKKMV